MESHGRKGVPSDIESAGELIHKKHGDATAEQKRGQKLWTKEDFEKLPDVLGFQDKITRGDRSNQDKYPLIQFEMQMEDGKTYVVEEIFVGRGVLKVVNGWVKNSSGEPHPCTSETHPAPKAGGNMHSTATKKSISPITAKQKTKKLNAIRRGQFNSVAWIPRTNC